ncbi:MAG: Beta-galactosidase C-terminal domain [Candidatus Microbacterium colombiense]|nr:MAG: Beta-galactosidase C-terminal domain [Microbacterium sp.]
MRAVLSEAVRRRGVPVPASTERDTDLEVVTRTDGATDYTFVLNHGRRTLTAPRIPGGRDLLTDADRRRRGPAPRALRRRRLAHPAPQNHGPAS